MACKFAEQAQEAFKLNTGWTHQVLDVHPNACQERAQHIVADCQHEGEVLIWCDESAQHQRLHRHQAVQARDRCGCKYCMPTVAQPCKQNHIQCRIILQ